MQPNPLSPFPHSLAPLAGKGEPRPTARSIASPRLRVSASLVLFLLALAANAQTYPFQDSFAAYGPGTTGAPYWSILSGRLVGGEQGLTGPVTLRLNSRPPRRYTVVMNVALPKGAPASFGLCANVQHEKDTVSCDQMTVSGSDGAYDVTSQGVGPTAFGPRTTAKVSLAPSETLTVRFVVDTETDSNVVFIGDQPGAASRSEYGPGLLAFFLGDGVRCTLFSVRAPTEAELQAAASHKLFSDPRDIAAAENGNILVLHRGDRGVLAVTPTGETVRSYGRRLTGFLTDPVAITSDAQGNVYVLNRFPGEVIVFSRFGRVTGQYGAGRLKEPSDLALLPDGSLYVADPGARRISCFDAHGEWLNDIAGFGPEGGTPIRLATGPLGNVLVSLRDPVHTVTMQPLPKGDAAVMSDSPMPVHDVTSLEGGAVAATPAGVQRWPLVANGPVYRATAGGGLGNAPRLTTVNGRAWVLNREEARLSEVPASMKDVEPTVEYADPAQTTAHIRWNSVQGAGRSRVQVKRGDKWDTFSEGRATETTEHHVLVVGLPAGQAFAYRVWPSVPTIPASDWSVEYQFPGAPTPSP